MTKYLISHLAWQGKVLFVVVEAENQYQAIKLFRKSTPYDNIIAITQLETRVEITDLCVRG